jgi:citrate synthase
MTSDVLFQITKDLLESGLRGFPVGYCTTSYVDPQKGLFYVDKPVDEVAFWQPQEVIYLLYHGKKGSEAEVAHFYEDLQKRAECSKETLRHIYALPRKGHPMDLFSGYSRFGDV